MKKVAALLVVVGSLLSGCLVYDEPNSNRGVYRGERDRDRDGIANRVDRDRDGDGVRNRQDGYPNDPRRY